MAAEIERSRWNINIKNNIRQVRPPASQTATFKWRPNFPSTCSRELHTAAVISSQQSLTAVSAPHLLLSVEPESASAATPMTFGVTQMAHNSTKSQRSHVVPSRAKRVKWRLAADSFSLDEFCDGNLSRVRSSAEDVPLWLTRRKCEEAAGPRVTT